jgi:hypothetical protein
MIRTSQQVGVAQVEKKMTRPRVFGLDELHYCLRGWLEAGASSVPLSKIYPTRHSANNVQTPVGMFENTEKTSSPADTLRAQNVSAGTWLLDP